MMGRRRRRREEHRLCETDEGPKRKQKLYKKRHRGAKGLREKARKVGTRESVRCQVCLPLSV